MLNADRLIIRLAGVLMGVLCLILSNAGGVANAQTSGGFSIHAIIPDNQIDTRQTYFDLRMRPGDEQTVEVVINNTRDEELIAEVRLNAASTGRNGVIVYTEPNVRNESMKVSITDVAALQTEHIKVPAHSSKSAMIDIKMPEEPIAGVILGGIAVTDGKAESSALTTEGVTLKNEITYVIALKLSENDNEIDADFELAAIKPELVNYRTAVIVTLQNRAARIIKDMDVNGQIFKKGSDIVLNQLVRDNAEMAPLSNGDFVIDWNNRPLERGTYRLKMTAEYEGRTWEWDEEFSIGEEAGDLNGEAMGLVRDYTWLYVLLGAIALAIIWFAAYRSGKRSRPNEGTRA